MRRRTRVGITLVETPWNANCAAVDEQNQNGVMWGGVGGDAGQAEPGERDGVLGEILFELFTDIEPQLCENFRALCSSEWADEAGNGGDGDGGPYGDPACIAWNHETHVVHVAAKQEVRLRSSSICGLHGNAGGRFSLTPARAGIADDGKGQRQGEPRLHDGSGLLTMLPSVDVEGTEEAGYAADFAVTLGECRERDRRGGARVFGRVLRGMGILREIERDPGAYVGAGAGLKLERELESAPPGGHLRRSLMRAAAGGASGVAPRPMGDANSPRSRETHKRREKDARGIIKAARCRVLEAEDDGTVLWPDGDPFPRWPQDALDMRARDQYENRVAAAETIKAYGSDAFSAGDFRLADAKYCKALRYLDKAFTRDAEVYEMEMRERVMQARLKVPLLLNCALCKIKCGDARGAIHMCNEAHTWLQTQASLDVHALMGGGNGSGTEKKSPKLLLRRGMAYAMCNEFDDALRDLRQAAAIMPKDGVIRRELERVQKNQREVQQRKRDTFAKMFGDESS